MKVSDLTRRLDELLQMGRKVLETKKGAGYSEYIDTAANAGFRSSVLSFINRVYGCKHPHFKEFEESTNGHYPSNTESGIAIVQAMKGEIEGGWLFTIKGLVTAEVFANFLEMAEHLLNTGYKDPAAVMCGSVLEEHLRQLCLKHNIPIVQERDSAKIPKKADRLNSELASADIYSKLDQKMITAWLDLRNKAAHGKYDEYTKDQVQHMLMAVTEFMARVSV